MERRSPTITKGIYVLLELTFKYYIYIVKIVRFIPTNLKTRYLTLRTYNILIN